MKSHTKHRIIHGVGLKEILRERLQDAFAKKSLKANAMSEFYLVNLLSDFNFAFEKPLAILMMDASHRDKQTKIKELKCVGDTALVIVGFFAERVQRTIMGLPYYTSMGGLAYRKLSSILSGGDDFVEVYLDLSSNFKRYAEAISIVAPWNIASSNTDIVKIYERWLSTRDNHLKKVLEKEGILNK